MKRAIFLFALLFGGFVFRGICCGIDWQIPENHFDGVNEWGELSYWTSIGELDLGDEQKSPIIIGFNPTRKSGSAYLGSGGWLLPILESHVEQTSENAFTLVQPDGRLRFFGRDRVTNDTLSGQGGWKGEINGDKISLWAECGWRMTFFKGKINSIETPKGREFDYQYQDGLVSGLTEKGAPILVVERDPSTGKVNGLTSGGKHVGIEIGQKPQVQNVQGTNLVVGLDYSLTKLTFPDGKGDTFTYGVDPALNPTLVIAGKDNRSFTWNPQTGVPLRDGDWTYQISLRKGNNPLFVRTNTQNQKEIWDLDLAKGQEIIQTLNGEQKIRTWFTSGILNGKPREYAEDKTGVLEVLETFSYDEQGRVLRYSNLKTHDCTTHNYSPDGTEKQTIVKAGRIVSTNILRDGRVVEREMPNGHKVSYEYNDMGAVIAMKDEKGTQWQYTYNSDGQLGQIWKNSRLNMSIYQLNTGSKIQAYFDAEGKVAKVWDVTKNLDYLGPEASAFMLQNKLTY